MFDVNDKAKSEYRRIEVVTGGERVALQGSDGDTREGEHSDG